MFSLFKKKQNKPDVPQWASFFNSDEYSEFAAAIDDYFYKKNVSYIFCDGQLEAGPNDFGFGNLGLMNVAQVCKQNKKADYKKRVTEHFDALLRNNEFDKEFKKMAHDYERIKQYIGVRLYHNEYVQVLGKDLTIGKDFAADLYAMLVFDLPNAVANITHEQAAKWGKTDDELFETGIENIKNKYDFEISEEPFDEINIWFVQGDHFFTPNIVFDLENHPELIGTKGSLIGMPHRHAVIVYPIEDMEVISAINTLMPVVNGMYEEGPGSISRNIFWYHEGHFENLPYEIGDGKIEFSPPESFLNMLNTL